MRWPRPCASWSAETPARLAPRNHDPIRHHDRLGLAERKEILSERESNLTEAVLKRQFEGGLGALTPAEFSRILLAYEPVWAIGTGKTATPEQAAQAHRYLRELAAVRFSFEEASALRILYGGSVKPDNIKGLMAQAEIDGALVGGASLDPRSFASIVNY